MPIVIKDFTWSQTTSSITITVPLNGVATHNTDVYSNDVYIKVNFPPYFFELDLYDSIDDQTAVAAVGNGCVKFTLPKINHVTWPDVRTTFKNPTEIAQRREEAGKRAQTRIEESRAVKAKERREKESYLVQQQMAVERADRARIAALKKAEQDAAVHELNAWKAEMTSKPSDKTTSGHTSHITPLPTHNADATEDASDEQSDPALNGPELITRIVEEVEEGESDEEVLAEALKAVAAQKRFSGKKNPSVLPPPPRRSASIPVRFTERLIPHPAREGPDAERNARAIAARNIGESIPSASKIKNISSADNDDGMSFEERDPLLMKERGDRFYKVKDYKAALNAYSRALELDGGKNVPTLSNRAATYLQMKEYSFCIADCTNAIQELERHDEYKIQNMIPFPERGSVEERVLRECRIRLLVRRGTACGQQGYLKEGLEDYMAALALDPHNSALAKDAERMEALLNGQNDGQIVGQ